MAKLVEARGDAWRALEEAQLKLLRHDKTRANLLRKLEHARSRYEFLARPTHECKPAPKKRASPTSEVGQENPEDPGTGPHSRTVFERVRDGAGQEI